MAVVASRGLDHLMMPFSFYVCLPKGNSMINDDSCRFCFPGIMSYYNIDWLKWSSWMKFADLKDMLVLCWLQVKLCGGLEDKNNSQQFNKSANKQALNSFKYYRLGMLEFPSQSNSAFQIIERKRSKIMLFDLLFQFPI